MYSVEDFLISASKQYYAGNPIISDEQFDSLAEAVGFSHVGAKQHENVEKHFQRMYSLQKYYVDEGVKPLSGYSDICSSPKLDGAAISLLYLEGNLVRGLTRGDGIEATDIPGSSRQRSGA